MEYKIHDSIKQTAYGERAEEILSNCVHCGMCNATCPTYQLLGDELDGPRGRIYQIKQVLEGEQATQIMQSHMDRCLTCLNCETTCPSGVEYGKLAEIGKELIEEQVERPFIDKVVRKLLRFVIPYPSRFAFLFNIGLFFRPILPTIFKKQIHKPKAAGIWPITKHNRQMLVLDGCVQSVMSSNINAATARILDKLGISLLSVKESGCCGAVNLHLQAAEEAKEFMRKNIDAWWPYVEAGAESIVMTASGCGSVVKDYHEHLSNDPLYATKAKKISNLVKDISEILIEEDLSKLKNKTNQVKVAAHIPCSLQHGQKKSGIVESVLSRLGYNLTRVQDPHLCCGSAGTYSILQAKIATKLRDNKLQALEKNEPDLIVTANVGCLHHLQSGTDKTVKHWIELLDES